MTDFNGKLVLVTGGGSGIGRACAELMARRGASIVIVDFNESNGQLVVDQLMAQGSEAFFIKVNVADPDQVQQMAQQLEQSHGRLDCLVNCAGISSTYLPLADYPLADWQAAIDINLNGNFYVMKFLLPLILAAGGGSIVNLSSIMGSVASPGGAAYAASKHAVVGLTKAVAQDYGSQGVRVNAVAPGVIETPMTAQAMTDEAGIAAMKMATPAGRFGKPEEVASLIAFLCSDESKFITGAYYSIDGGFLSH